MIEKETKWDATKRAKQSRKDIPPCDAAHCYYFSRCRNLKSQQQEREQE